MPFVLLTDILRTVYLHPPTFALLAFIKDDGLFVFLYRHMVFEKIIHDFPREFIGTTGKSIDEIPDHLSGEMGCLSATVIDRIGFEEANRTKFITETSITGHLTCLLAIESIWGSIEITGSIRHPDCRNVQHHHICIANQWLY